MKNPFFGLIMAAGLPAGSLSGSGFSELTRKAISLFSRRTVASSTAPGCRSRSTAPKASISLKRS